MMPSCHRVLLSDRPCGRNPEQGYLKRVGLLVPSILPYKAMTLSDSLLPVGQNGRWDGHTSAKPASSESSSVRVPGVWRMSVVLSLAIALLALFLNPTLEVPGRVLISSGMVGDQVVAKKGPAGHKKDCESKDFTKTTMKLLNEEVVMRLSHNKVRRCLLRLTEVFAPHIDINQRILTMLVTRKE